MAGDRSEHYYPHAPPEPGWYDVVWLEPWSPTRESQVGIREVLWHDRRGWELQPGRALEEHGMRVLGWIRKTRPYESVDARP